MFCIACGTQAHPEGKFCAHCGKQLERAGWPDAGNLTAGAPAAQNLDDDLDQTVVSWRSHVAGPVSNSANSEPEPVAPGRSTGDSPWNATADHSAAAAQPSSTVYEHTNVSQDYRAPQVSWPSSTQGVAAHDQPWPSAAPAPGFGVGYRPPARHVAQGGEPAASAILRSVVALFLFAWALARPWDQPGWYESAPAAENGLALALLVLAMIGAGIGLFRWTVADPATRTAVGLAQGALVAPAAVFALVTDIRMLTGNGFSGPAVWMAIVGALLVMTSVSSSQGGEGWRVIAAGSLLIGGILGTIPLFEILSADTYGMLGSLLPLLLLALTPSLFALWVGFGLAARSVGEWAGALGVGLAFILSIGVFGDRGAFMQTGTSFTDIAPEVGMLLLLIGLSAATAPGVPMTLNNRSGSPAELWMKSAGGLIGAWAAAAGWFALIIVLVITQGSRPPSITYWSLVLLIVTAIVGTICRTTLASNPHGGRRTTVLVAPVLALAFLITFVALDGFSMDAGFLTLTFIWPIAAVLILLIAPSVRRTYGPVFPGLIDSSADGHSSS